MDYIPKDGLYTDEVGGIINPFENKHIWIWYEKTHTQYFCGRINLNMKWTSQYGICLFRRLPWLCELWIPWDRSYATRARHQSTWLKDICSFMKRDVAAKNPGLCRYIHVYPCPVYPKMARAGFSTVLGLNGVGQDDRRTSGLCGSDDARRMKNWPDEHIFKVWSDVDS